jgi:hypothetical protein
MVFKLVQFLNALMAIDVRLLGKMIVERFVQPSKEEPPIDSTPSVRYADFKPVQSSKAELPIDFTLPGILRNVMLRH